MVSVLDAPHIDILIVAPNQNIALILLQSRAAHILVPLIIGFVLLNVEEEAQDFRPIVPVLSGFFVLSMS